MLSSVAPNLLVVLVLRAIQPSKTSVNPVKVYIDKKGADDGERKNSPTVPIMRSSVIPFATVKISLRLFSFSLFDFIFFYKIFFHDYFFGYLTRFSN